MPPIRVSDIAEAVDAAENSRLAAWADATPAIILNIQRQPGTNVIEVVDRVKKLLPQLQASLPSSVDVTLLTDRTVTIRGSVRDVEFELLLAVALVVMVIFLFLRNLPATFIPSVAVPLSLVGTFGVMYLAGFSINNLTLMALTIATGFVVDDAIVVIENIARYLEEGDSPLDAALKGTQQIAFTIISLTFSLIAVLIPLLFMGDVVGRLFREFAITLAVAILISAVVSLTLTPMMCAKLLRHTPPEKQGRFYRWSGELFERMIARYGRMLNWVLDRQRATLVVAVATLVLTGILYVVIPKGFFPIQDTGAIQGISEAPQTISFAAMADRQQALAKVVLEDPAVASLTSFIGVDGANATLNSGRMLINLKPRSARNASATAIIRRLQPKLAQVPGIALYMQPVQDLTIEDRVSRTQYQFTIETAHPTALGDAVQRLTDRLRTVPELADVASDWQDGGLAAYVEIDRATASRMGITPATIDNALYNAFGQRLVSTIFTQTNQYRVVLEVKPEFQRGPGALDDLHVTSVVPGQPPQQVPLSTIARVVERPTQLAINHIGQFPSATISFNLSPGTSLGEAVKAIENVRTELALPESVQLNFQGAALAFRASLSNELWLILAAIVTMYIVLGVLYESFIHPITILSTLPSAGVGALLALILTGNDLVDHRDHRHHPADRHRQEERDHDDRLRAPSRTQRRQGAPRRDLRGVPAALSPDHDDDDVGDSGRAAADDRMGRRLGAPSPAWHHDGRRPHLLAGADAVHDPRHLPCVRPAGPRACTRGDSPTRRLPTPAADHRDEPLGSVHRPTGRDDAAHRGRRTGGHDRVHAPAGLAVAAGRLSDDFRASGAARCEPGNDGGHGRDTARAFARPHRGRDRDDVVKLARVDPDHAAVRLEPRYRWRGPRRAGGDQRGARVAAERPAEQPDVSQGQPGRCADHDPDPHVGHDDAGADVRRGIDDHCAEALAGRRRGAGERRRQLAAGGAGRTQSRDAVQVRRRAGGRAQRARVCQRKPSERIGRGRRPALADPRQRPGEDRGRIPAADRRVAQRSAGPAVRRRGRRRLGAGPPQRRDGERPPSVLVIINRQPNANIIETVDRLRALLPSLRASIPSAITLNTAMERTATIRGSLRDTGGRSSSRSCS